MSKTVADIHVFGFEDEDLQAWPVLFGLNPIELGLDDLDTLSEDVPILAHARKAAELTRRLEREGISNDVILYLPAGESIPKGAYYEARITDQELSRLSGLLTHPQQFRMRELAEDIPLQSLTKPVQSLDLNTLPLPTWASEHLEGCVTCKDALRNALGDRVRLYQMMWCPHPNALIAFVRQGRDSDGRMAKHLATCPLCAAQAQVLRDVEGESHEVQYTPWLLAEIKGPGTWMVGEATSGTTDEARRKMDDVREVLRRRLGVVLDLFDHARIEAAWEAAWDKVDSAVDDFQEQLEDLYTLREAMLSGISVVFTAADKRLHIGWDSDSQAPYITLEDAERNAVRRFSIELQQGADLVWSAQTEQGRLTINPDAIEDAIRTYEAGRYPERDAPYTIAILAQS